FLRMLDGDEAWIAIGIKSRHAAHRDWARVKDIEIIVSDAPPEPLRREPKYPLKTGRTLHSDEDIATARHNVEQYVRAREIRDGILEQAQPWLERSDARILELIPPASVPRGFDLSTRGCPVHGKEVFDHGRYPWILDPEKPYQV